LFAVFITVVFLKFKGNLLGYGSRDIKKVVEVVYPVIMEYGAQVKKGGYFPGECPQRSPAKNKKIKLQQRRLFLDQ
jgi:hypothetical protein